MPKKKKRRKGGNLQATAFKFIRLGSLLAPGLHTFGEAQAHYGGDMVMAGASALAGYGGWDTAQGKFRPELFAKHWLPFLGSVAATYGIPKLVGIIRRI